MNQVVTEAQEFVEFRWPRAPRHIIGLGVRQNGEEEAVLVEETEGHSLDHEPLRDPVLFRTVAEAPLTQEGVLDLANRYGLLGVLDDTFVCIENVPDVRWAGEPVRRWLHELEKLRVWVKVWELSGGTTSSPALCAALTSLIEAPVFGDDVASGRDAELLVRDLQEPQQDLRHLQVARRLVARAITTQLQDVQATVVCSATGFRLKMRPRTLLDGLWLQFAEAVTARAKHRRCLNCGKWLEISPAHRRTNSKTCSGACRTQLHRRNRAKRGPQSESLSSEPI